MMTNEMAEELVMSSVLALLQNLELKAGNYAVRRAAGKCRRRLMLEGRLPGIEGSAEGFEHVAEFGAGKLGLDPTEDAVAARVELRSRPFGRGFG
jgi:hypothetical protein